MPSLPDYDLLDATELAALVRRKEVSPSELGPYVGEGWHGIAVEHALTRSVRDSAALLDATQGPDLGAPYVAPAPAARCPPRRSPPA